MSTQQCISLCLPIQYIWDEKRVQKGLYVQVCIGRLTFTAKIQ